MVFWFIDAELSHMLNRLSQGFDIAHKFSNEVLFLKFSVHVCVCEVFSVWAAAEKENRLMKTTGEPE